MALADVRQEPPAAFATNMTCPAAVTADDIDYLLEVLRLDSGKTESDLDEEVLEKARALGIDATKKSPAAENGPPATTTTLDAYHSTVSLPSCHARNPALLSSSSSSSQDTAKSSTSIASGAFALDAACLAATAATTESPDPRRSSDTLDFSLYNSYLSQLGPNIAKHKVGDAGELGQTQVVVARKGGIASFRSGILKTRIPWGRRLSAKPVATTSCVCCREDFDQSGVLHSLPCGHTYCHGCLRVMVDQATTDEAKMPPQCCTLPIPSSALDSLLKPDERLLFLKAVVQFSTPWELRVFCPKSTCGEFIPPRPSADAKHPFVVVCRRCGTSACSMCKREAHEAGRDCPDDFELDAVLEMGERSGWRRCYRCRTLVELVQGCTHMTCRCKAQFCYICGAAWDPDVGCPGFCNGEEEMERRRAQEEARAAAREAEEEANAAERLDAERRTAGSAEFRQLREAQAEELGRFTAYAERRRDVMWAGQLARKLSLAERQSDHMGKMAERHAKTVVHLEDRQVRAEMDLRETLEQSERSVNIRLRHMEAYCAGLGRGAGEGEGEGEEKVRQEGGEGSDGGGGAESDLLPRRNVTERDLRELAQQYALRDGMERMRNSRINMLRDRQLKAAEELEERQREERRSLAARRAEEMDRLAAEFALAEDALAAELAERRRRLQWRWALAVEVLRRGLGERDGVRYAAVAIPEWPREEGDGWPTEDGGVEVVGGTD